MNEKRTEQRLLMASLLFGLLLNYPILSIFNSNRLLFGLPQLYVYLFVTWGVLILLIYRIASNIQPPKDHSNE